MGDISIKGRSKLLGGGRVGFKSGGRAGFKSGGRTGFKSGSNYVPDVAKSAQHPHSKLKTQKEYKKITDSAEYKKADYTKKTEMLGGKVYHSSGGRAGLKDGGRTGKQFGGPLARQSLARPGVMPTRPIGLKDGGRTGFKKGTKASDRHPPAAPFSVRRDTEALIGKGNLAEKFIKFGEAFNKKQKAKWEKKKATKQMKKRAKKLTAYEGIT